MQAIQAATALICYDLGSADEGAEFSFMVGDSTFCLDVPFGPATAILRSRWEGRSEECRGWRGSGVEEDRKRGQTEHATNVR